MQRQGLIPLYRSNFHHRSISPWPNRPVVENDVAVGTVQYPLVHIIYRYQRQYIPKDIVQFPRELKLAPPVDMAILMVLPLVPSSRLSWLLEDLVV